MRCSECMFGHFSNSHDAETVLLQANLVSKGKGKQAHIVIQDVRWTRSSAAALMPSQSQAGTEATADPPASDDTSATFSKKCSQVQSFQKSSNPARASSPISAHKAPLSAPEQGDVAHVPFWSNALYALPVIRTVIETTKRDLDVLHKFCKTTCVQHLICATEVDSSADPPCVDIIILRGIVGTYAFHLRRFRISPGHGNRPASALGNLAERADSLPQHLCMYGGVWLLRGAFFCFSWRKSS